MKQLFQEGCSKEWAVQGEMGSKVVLLSFDLLNLRKTWHLPHYTVPRAGTHINSRHP